MPSMIWISFRMWIDRLERILTMASRTKMIFKWRIKKNYTIFGKIQFFSLDETVNALAYMSFVQCWLYCNWIECVLWSLPPQKTLCCHSLIDQNGFAIDSHQMLRAKEVQLKTSATTFSCWHSIRFQFVRVDHDLHIMAIYIHSITKKRWWWWWLVNSPGYEISNFLDSQW